MESFGKLQRKEQSPETPTLQERIAEIGGLIDNAETAANDNEVVSITEEAANDNTVHFENLANEDPDNSFNVVEELWEEKFLPLLGGQSDEVKAHVFETLTVAAETILHDEAVFTLDFGDEISEELDRKLTGTLQRELSHRAIEQLAA